MVIMKRLVVLVPLSIFLWGALQPLTGQSEVRFIVGRYEIKVPGQGGGDAVGEALQIVLWDKVQAEERGSIVFLPEGEVREHRCAEKGKKITVFYRESEFETVTELLRTMPQAIVYCNGPKDGGLTFQSFRR